MNKVSSILKILGLVVLGIFVVLFLYAKLSGNSMSASEDDFIVHTNPNEVAVDVSQEEFDKVEAKALAGDYYAMRNIAFGYSDEPYSGQKLDRVMACAWRRVILEFNTEKLDASDASNFRVYCNLDAKQIDLAAIKADELISKIKSTK